MPLDSNLNLKHTSNHLNQTDTTNPKICQTTTTIEFSEPPSSTSIEILVTPEKDQVTSQDWFNLSQKLRKQNRELLENIVTLEQSLAECQQQLQGEEQEAHQNNFIIAQKPAKIKNIKEQFQAIQKQLQQQQQELNTSQKRLVITQSKLAQIEHQCTLLKQGYREKADQLDHSQKQVEELQTRLQRQQRYALQYKAALDECLSKLSARKQVQPSINSLSSAKTLTPQINSIKIWSEQLTGQKVSESVLDKVQPRALLERIATSNPPTKSEPLSSLGHFNQPLQNPLFLTPEIPESMKQMKTNKEGILNQKNPEFTSADFNPKTVAKYDIHSQKMVTPTPQKLAVQPPVTFSFDIGCNKPHDKVKIDLPSFLSRRH